MKIVKTVDEVRVIVKEWKKEGLTVGLVPTMGFLHEGHKSLITRAVSENDRVVVSDFVNPTQFGVGEDLESYPRDLERDTMLCEEAGANLIFNPEPENMYFDDFSTYVNIESLSEELCGKSRPIHFRGVGTVVSKLFNIVNPDRAYFGQKDAQQLAIIKRMVRDSEFPSLSDEAPARQGNKHIVFSLGNLCTCTDRSRPFSGFLLLSGYALYGLSVFRSISISFLSKGVSM